MTIATCSFPANEVLNSAGGRDGDHPREKAVNEMAIK